MVKRDGAFLKIVIDAEFLERLKEAKQNNEGLEDVRIVAVMRDGKSFESPMTMGEFLGSVRLGGLMAGIEEEVCGECHGEGEVPSEVWDDDVHAHVPTGSVACPTCYPEEDVE